jgi:ubiquinone/menaquinone biosynthesis C-methylase UbiE
MSSYGYNKAFLDPEKVLFRSGLSAGQTVADLGAGSGFYALAAAKVVGNNGKVYVVDILESSLAHVSADARLKMIKNIQTIQADLERSNLTPIPDGSCDLVILANLLHQLKNNKNLLTQAYRILKTKGKLLVVDWSDKPSPIGPKSDERISEEAAKKLLSAAGLKLEASVETDTYHYGLIFIK